MNKAFISLIKKELIDYFESPTLYLLAALLNGVLGFLFFNLLLNAKEYYQHDLTQKTLLPLFGYINFVFLFFTPILAMKSYSEEFRTQTFSLLLLSKLTSLQIIFAKFISLVLVFIFLLSFTLVFPTILAVSGYSDFKIMFSGYLGLILIFCCYIAFCQFVSSLTKSVALAALISFLGLLFFLFLSYSATVVNNPVLSQMLVYGSFLFHLEGFMQGILKSYDFVYIISFCGFFMYGIKVSMQAKRW